MPFESCKLVTVGIYIKCFWVATRRCDRDVVTHDARLTFSKLIDTTESSFEKVRPVSCVTTSRSHRQVNMDWTPIQVFISWVTWFTTAKHDVALTLLLGSIFSVG